jgi:hypothetical protein
MNKNVKNLMIKHGLHKHITEDCQNRMEMLAKLVAEECAQLCMSQADRRNIRLAFDLSVESNVKYPSPEANNSINSQYNRPLNLL